MKLAQIILPATHSLHPTHLLLQQRISQRWHGYTAWRANGYWQPSDGNAMYEEVVVYAVAMERTDVIHLRELAMEIAQLGSQQCVMIVTPQGDVEFIKPRKEQSNAQR